jgi:hypothetical protein
VHLAYLDDSDTKSKRRKWQVMAGVIIEDSSFKIAELGVSIVPELLMPADKIDSFVEFHACELYGGFGVFEGIDQNIRFDAIRRLLFLIPMMELGVIYGAVDLEKFRNEIYGSADPLDAAFRMCMKCIEKWSSEDSTNRVTRLLGDNIGDYKLENAISHVFDSALNTLVMLIVDECSDKKVREILHTSYRTFRPRRHSVRERPIDCFHDDMYFGDSRYSIGIQLADLCSYFIGRHLDNDQETESFYEIIQDRIRCSQTFPPVGDQEQQSSKTPEEIADAE